MTKPLADVHDTYQVLQDLLIVVRRVLANDAEPLRKLERFSDPDVSTTLNHVQQRLDQLFVLALFASFERELKGHVAEELAQLESMPTSPPELARSLHKQVLRDVEHWRMDAVPRLFMPAVSHQDLAAVGAARRFRHETAHGHEPSEALHPTRVFDHLQRFLDKAGVGVNEGNTYTWESKPSE